MSPPVITIVGYSDSGKTRVASYLINYFSTCGYRVAAIKHCHDGHDMDKPRSDTARLRESGASLIIASSPGHVTSMEYGEKDLSLEEILPTIRTSVDIVIAEGFKTSTVPKVMIIDDNAVYPEAENVIAIVSNVNGDWALPTYGFDQLELLADQIHDDLPTVELQYESVSLNVDGKSIPLNRFPSAALSGIIQGFVASLSGIPDSPKGIKVEVQIED